MQKTVSEVVYLSYCKLKTALLFPSARLVRFPVDIRGRKGIDFGRSLTTGKYCRLETHCNKKEKVLHFGNDVQINDFVHIVAKEKVFIGNNVLIASKVFITDCEHGSYKGDENDSFPLTDPKERELSSNPVVIEDNVWIGENVSILPGVTIGKGSVIGANSVVTKSIPEFSIAAGSPARVIKEFNFEIKKWEKI